MVPKYNEFMLPVLKRLASHQKEESLSELMSFVIDELKISEEDQNKIVPSGRSQTYLYNRLSWALTYLRKAGLIQKVRRGTYQVTEFGKSELKKFQNKKIETLTSKFLTQYESFKKFNNVPKKMKENEEVSENNTPLESFEAVYRTLKENLKEDMLERMHQSSYQFFERLVVDLLLNMGYGGSKKEAGEAFQTTRDGGIDGTIYEDKLGLDLIHIQAKRWVDSVGRPEIQKFAGALQGKRVKKGVFITTSTFSKDAEEYVKNLDSKIILIDGDKLTDYMFESETGVLTDSVYKIKKINEDYFEDLAPKRDLKKVS